MPGQQEQSCQDEQNHGHLRKAVKKKEKHINNQHDDILVIPMARCPPSGEEMKGEICVTQYEVKADEPQEKIDVLTDWLNTVSAMQEEEGVVKYFGEACGAVEEMIESAERAFGKAEKVMEGVE